MDFDNRPPGFMSGNTRFEKIRNPNAGFPGPGKYDYSLDSHKYSMSKSFQSKVN